MNTKTTRLLFRTIILLLLAFPICPSIWAQTASFNFTAGPTTISGWTNVAGDPSVAVTSVTDPATGISISSIATANWHPYDVSAYDGLGAPNGTFFPAAVLLNHWFQYDGSLSTYNPASPQLRISGLKQGMFYTLRMAGSSTSGLNSNPTRYTVAGSTVYGYKDVNSHANTADGAVFNHIAPDATGVLNIYVNTLSTTDVGDISGLQIIAEPSYWSAAGNAGLNPAQSFLGTVDATGLPFRTNNQERMRIGPGGNVLIGTTADDGGGEILQVAGTQTINTGSVSQQPLSIYTNNIYSPFLVLSNINTATGASIGIRYYNANGVVSQFFAGGPANHFMPNGFAFHDVSGGGFDFVGYSPTSFVSWGNNFKVLGGSKMIFYPTPGNLLIGSTTDNGAKLQVTGNATVNGTITSKIVKVTPNGWSDYVFDSTYHLPLLRDVNSYIKTNKHLPDMISAPEVDQNGLDLGSNQAALLKKIEELTLYMIQQDEALKKVNSQLSSLQKEIKTLKKIKGLKNL